jgi:S-adenosylhomocysteine hydrolase
MSTHPKIQKCLAEFDSELIPSTIPEELPLIDRFRRERPGRGLFSDVDVLFIQHHIGPLIAKLEAMVAEGLDRKRCWFVDIPYSTNSEIRAELGKRGYRKDHMTGLFSDPLEDYDESQSIRMTYLMQRLADRDRPRRLLVMDDGGYFVRYLKNVTLHSPELLRAFKGAAVVEQTTRGHRYLKQLKRDVVDACGLSVVSIARCHTKLKFEAPFIGASVSRALVRSCGEERLSGMKHIAVIGYGAVGKATVEQLAQKTRRALIDVIDVDEQALRAASGVVSSRGTRFRGRKELSRERQYELVLGCTGYNSFRLDQRGLLADDALLASGSSAAVEFNRTGFVELADRRSDDELRILDRAKTRKAGIHSPIRFAQEGGKTFTFLNAGFPVNFDGRMESLPARIIQATHCLLYAACIQALNQKQPGLKRINSADDQWIFDNALHEI